MIIIFLVGPSGPLRPHVHAFRHLIVPLGNMTYVLTCNDGHITFPSELTHQRGRANVKVSNGGIRPLQ